MNITFLIGNGFDRNLGLNTTYSDFVKDYKNLKADNNILADFRRHIKENQELWSAAELALGHYTGELRSGQGKAFSECQIDFCNQLAAYLKKQESRIEYASSEEAIVKAFSHLNNLIQSFPTQEKNVLNTIYQKYISEGISFRFICYNYTRTLDECIALVKKKSSYVGMHKNGSITLNHTLGRICHVHGTVETEMVFGVNDESQIDNLDLFDCENGDIYKNMLIKRNANASYQEYTDEEAAKLISESQIIYVYGMSIGETDNLWWDRICAWLDSSNMHHLILQKHKPPRKGVISTEYQVFEREQRKEFTRHSTLNQAKKSSIENRIHITGENIFADISNIAAT
jgi:hypothetical protein|nr:AbiH family protein [uncultured Oscillibacter sp.]